MYSNGVIDSRALIAFYDELKGKEWDCLGVWVVVDPPADFPYASGDVVSWSDIGWRLHHEGEVSQVDLDNHPIDWGMIQNASWAHRVSQWKVYVSSLKDMITLIDRSK